jgi:hypothetical protein
MAIAGGPEATDTGVRIDVITTAARCSEPATSPEIYRPESRAAVS